MKKTLAGIIAAAVAAGVLWAADEITVQGTLVAKKNNTDVRETPGTVQIDWAGNYTYGQTLALTTNPVALAKGEIGSCGYAFFRNVATNYALKISFEADFGTEALHLKAGEYAVLRLATNCVVTNMRARADGQVTNTATATLQYLILED